MERKTRADSLTGNWWNILIRFYHMYGWRIMQGRAETGDIVNYLMIPMEYNGITTNKQGLPYMSLDAIPLKDPDRHPMAFTHSLSPHLSRERHEELVRMGWLDDRDEYWSVSFGGIRKFREDRLRKMDEKRKNR